MFPLFVEYEFSLLRVSTDETRGNVRFESRRGKSVRDRRSDEKSETLSFPRWQAVNERPPLSLSVLSMHWRLGPRVTIITRCTHACPTLRDRGANQLLYLLPYLFDPARRIPPRSVRRDFAKLNESYGSRRIVAQLWRYDSTSTKDIYRNDVMMSRYDDIIVREMRSSRSCSDGQRSRQDIIAAVIR